MFNLMKTGVSRSTCLRNVAIICKDFDLGIPTYLTYTREGVIVIWRPHSFKQMMSSLPKVRGLHHLWACILRWRSNRQDIKDWCKEVYQHYGIVAHMTVGGNLYVGCGPSVVSLKSVTDLWIRVEKVPFRYSFIPWR